MKYGGKVNYGGKVKLDKKLDKAIDDRFALKLSATSARTRIWRFVRFAKINQLPGNSLFTPRMF